MQGLLTLIWCSCYGPPLPTAHQIRRTHASAPSSVDSVLQVSFSTKQGLHKVTALCKNLDGTPLAAAAAPALDAWADAASTSTDEPSQIYLLEPRRWLVGRALAPSSPDGKVSAQEVQLSFAKGASIACPLSGISQGMHKGLAHLVLCMIGGMRILDFALCCRLGTFC